MTCLKSGIKKHRILSHPPPPAHSFHLLLRQMQDLAEDYQRALADISSLRAIYDAEIESLQEEVSQCKAAKAEELWRAIGVRRMGGLNVVGWSWF